MELSITPNQKFKSRANPIKPFVINTQYGKLTIAEAGRRDFRRRKFSEKLTKMLCKNYATLTNDPTWLKFNNPNKTYECSTHVRKYAKTIEKRLNKADDDLTLLLAKDKKNKIQGVCLAYGLEDIPEAKNTTYYVEALAVNNGYRGCNVGKALLESVLDSAKYKYTDAFLTGEYLAKGFYSKLGFNPLDENDKAQKTVINYMARKRFDYPKYVEFLTKPLQIDKPRWFEKSAEFIHKYFGY